jgi:hypothetical protein
MRQKVMQNGGDCTPAPELFQHLISGERNVVSGRTVTEEKEFGESGAEQPEAKAFLCFDPLLPIQRVRCHRGLDYWAR